jgi:HPt (histidine-containing phosphotransfer) domain-containing protein
VFVADSGALVARIEQALAGRNFHEFRSLLHAMKGSSASMGTDRLTALCASLGRQSDGELRLQGPALLRSIEDEFNAARVELERYLRERKQSTG